MPRNAKPSQSHRSSRTACQAPGWDLIHHRLLEEVEIRSVPRQKQQIAMVTLNRQRQSMNARVVGVPAVVGDAVHRRERLAQRVEIGRGQTLDALAVAQCAQDAFIGWINRHWLLCSPQYRWSGPSLARDGYVGK